MSSVRRVATIARLPLAATILVLAGCGEERLAAPRVLAKASFEATLVRLADGSVKVHAVATNTGAATIYYGWSCALGGIGMSVHGPQGPLRIYDPCLAWPACPDGWLPLAPGERVERSFTYGGYQYGDTCHSRQPIPPGRYEMVAGFTWVPEPLEPPSHTLIRRLPFDWPAP